MIETPAHDLHQVILAAEQRRDLARLQQLHQALTTHRKASYYAQMPADEAKRAAEIAEAALHRLSPNPKARRPVLPKVREPLQLDLASIEQGDLFADPERWPRHPYCSDDLENGLRIRSLAHAVRKPYIQANPPHLRVWTIHDIDRPGAANAWEEAGLPPPSWTSINKANGHAHSVWGLRAPVLVDSLSARDAPLRYLAAVESLMRERLQADDGFAGLITKNPAHPLWRTLRGPREFYDLGELAKFLPGIEKHKPKRKRPEEVGIGRNVALFDTLRHWSYRSIRKHFGGGLDAWNAWLSECNSRALVYNGEFQRPLDGREVWHIARSVAKWVWRNFSAAEFSDWQAAAGAKGGKVSGEVRLAASEDKRASARLMRAKGMTQAAIAAELGVSQMTVSRWVRKL